MSQRSRTTTPSSPWSAGPSSAVNFSISCRAAPKSFLLPNFAFTACSSPTQGSAHSNLSFHRFSIATGRALYHIEDRGLVAPKGQIFLTGQPHRRLARMFHVKESIASLLETIAQQPLRTACIPKFLRPTNTSEKLS